MFEIVIYPSYLAECLQFQKYHFLSAKGSRVTAVPADECANHQVDDLELAEGSWWEELNNRSGTDKNCTAIKKYSSSFSFTTHCCLCEDSSGFFDSSCCNFCHFYWYVQYANIQLRVDEGENEHLKEKKGYQSV